MRKIILPLIIALCFFGQINAKNNISFDDAPVEELVKEVMNHQFGKENYRDYLDCWLMTKVYNEKPYTYCIMPEGTVGDKFFTLKTEDYERIYFYAKNWEQLLIHQNEDIKFELGGYGVYYDNFPGILGLFVLEKNTTDNRWRYLAEDVLFIGKRADAGGGVNKKKLNNNNLVGFLFIEKMKGHMANNEYKLLISHESKYRNIFTFTRGLNLIKKVDGKEQSVYHRNDVIIDDLKEINGMYLIRVETVYPEDNKKIQTCYFEYDLDKEFYIEKNCTKE